MCRKGAGEELTVVVTSGEIYSKPDARYERRKSIVELGADCTWLFFIFVEDYMISQKTGFHKIKKTYGR